MPLRGLKLAIFALFYGSVSRHDGMLGRFVGNFGDIGHIVVKFRALMVSQHGAKNA